MKKILTFSDSHSQWLFALSLSHSVSHSLTVTHTHTHWSVLVVMWLSPGEMGAVQRLELNRVNEAQGSAATCASAHNVIWGNYRMQLK